MHASLYVLLILQPMLGWAATAAGGFPVQFFRWTLPGLLAKDEAFSKTLYGIHGVEALYAVMGRGCVSVSRRSDAANVDVTTGKWKDGRVGIYHGTSGKAEKQPVLRVWAEGGMTDSTGTGGYEGLVLAIAEFFHTGKPPVDPAETLEVFEFMSAAQLSAERGGAEVPLADVRK